MLSCLYHDEALQLFSYHNVNFSVYFVALQFVLRPCVCIYYIQAVLGSQRREKSLGSFLLSLNGNISFHVNN